MVDNDFSTLDVQKILKINQERFKQWVNMGFIKPTLMASGQGSRASFTREDVYKVAFLNLLINGGWKRKAAAKICQSAEFDNPTYYQEFEGGIVSGLFNLKGIKADVDSIINQFLTVMG